MTTIYYGLGAATLKHRQIANMGLKNGMYLFTLLIIHILFGSTTALSNNISDAQILLTFKASLVSAEALSNWNPDVAVCSWSGVLCIQDEKFVFGLMLENMGLSGTIDMDTLAELPSMRSLSLMNNSFGGPMPDVQKLGMLRGIFLSNNNFSGVIRDDAFEGMSFLRRVDLKNNKFTGGIPGSLTALGELFALEMQNNDFEGVIPDFEQKGLLVNFANNTLSGPIPPGLRNQDPSVFAGNNVCGPPVTNPCKSFKKKNILNLKD